MKKKKKVALTSFNFFGLFHNLININEIWDLNNGCFRWQQQEVLIGLKDS